MALTANASLVAALRRDKSETAGLLVGTEEAVHWRVSPEGLALLPSGVEVVGAFASVEGTIDDALIAAEEALASAGSATPDTPVLLLAARPVGGSASDLEIEWRTGGGGQASVTEVEPSVIADVFHASTYCLCARLVVDVAGTGSVDDVIAALTGDDVLYVLGSGRVTADANEPSELSLAELLARADNVGGAAGTGAKRNKKGKKGKKRGPGPSAEDLEEGGSGSGTGPLPLADGATVVDVQFLVSGGGSALAPVIEFSPRESVGNGNSETVGVSAVVYASREAGAIETLRRLQTAVADQIRTLLGVGGAEPTAYNFELTRFFPWAITACYPFFSAPGAMVDESALEATRLGLHRALFLPQNLPLLRASSASPMDVRATAGSDGDGLERGLGRLLNVHARVNPPGDVGGTLFLVDGDYAYYHYMQDSFNDDGWGCAYRSLQTLSSWLHLQHYTVAVVPSHREIQQTLVALNDKPKTFVGSRQWIGAIEVGMVLQRLYGIDYKVLNVASGADLADYGRQLAAHFVEQGTPVMMGGGVLAYTLLGVCWNERTGAVRFLILDPHYTGSDDISTIVRKKWCAWHDVTLFDATSFYNLCLPQRPSAI